MLAQVEVDPAHELPAEDRVRDDERVVIGRRARGGDVADAQLGLRRARPRHDGDRRRLRHERLVRDVAVDAADPAAECVRRQPHDALVIAVADGDQRRHGRPDRSRVKRAHVVDRHRRERRFAPDRRMAVRMRAVEQPEKRAIGERAGHVAQLRQAVQPQLPHAREVVLAQRRAHDDVGEQAERALREAAENGDARHRRVGSDVGVELRAEARERFVDLDRGSLAAPFVEHVRRDRGEAVLAGGIGRRAAAYEQRERDERHLRVAHRPDAQAVLERRLLDRRKRERGRGAWRREPRAIGLRRADRARAAHETTATAESAAASAARPSGTMLSVTRRRGSRYRSTAARSDALVTSW